MSRETDRSERRRRLPRNLWVASVTSFLTDVSTEMVVNVLPLFLANVLGVRTWAIGLIEGAAASTASLVNLFSGALSDRAGSRKWPAVAGYALSTLAKPGFALATSWSAIGAVRWLERVGKGVRTAPRDALVADSIREEQRGVAFGLHRAADTGGAVVGLLLAIGVLALVAGGAAGELGRGPFRMLVFASLVPAGLAVLVLALGARDIPVDPADRARPPATFRGLGRPFLLFLAVSALFDLANFSDAFLVLRAQEQGVSVSGILWMLVAFNAVYALTATPAGWLSDRIGRVPMLATGWALYAAVQLGFAFGGGGGDVLGLFVAYGVYHGLTVGTGKAVVADLVPAHARGTAYGAYAATLGAIDLPASLVAGLLWQGFGDWGGFGPAAPFAFAAAVAGAASVALPILVRTRDRASAR